MMRAIFCVLMFALISGLHVCDSAAQATGAVGVLRPAVRDFSQTPDGDWLTTIKAPDGSERPYLYVPPTKIAPRVHTRVALEGTGPDIRIVYQYQIANGTTAKQQLAWLWIDVAQPVIVRQTPVRWQAVKPAKVGAVGFFGPPDEQGTPSGIAPGGATNDLTLESLALPGVINVRAMGNTAGAVTIPADLTSRQRQELTDLSRVSTVATPAIGPAIPAGIGESELSGDVLLSRIGSHYNAAFARAAHPYARDVATVFVRTIEPGASLTAPNVQAALATLRELSGRAVTDPWHQDLSDALGVCVDALASGAFPLKRPSGTPDR